eukprot:TRINITY_DN66853_c4_g16_i1.p1 TRINITY_DN66853_c4_g16~~TRINITY_DN66853_c4_g16_i1.p1  ORF type:complete len:577 (+),score=38.15 TRINITY_DN66853_c4_g16_i1:24-1733(+)
MAAAALLRQKRTAKHQHEEAQLLSTLLRSVDKFPDEWQKSTAHELNTAAQAEDDANRLQVSAKLLTKQLKREEQAMDNEVLLQIRKKVSHTVALKAKLEKALSATAGELQTLVSVRNRAQTTLNNHHRPLKLAQTRLHIRSQRPDREQVHDELEDALHNEATFLSSSATDVSNGVHKATLLIAQLENCVRDLEHDLGDKTKALELDKLCLTTAMDGQQPSSLHTGAPYHKADEMWGARPVTPTPSSLERPGSAYSNVSGLRPHTPLIAPQNTSAANPASVSMDTLSVAVTPGPAAMRNLTRSSQQHPRTWREQTQALIKHSKDLIAQSVELRRKIARTRKEASECIAKVSTRTTTAGKSKLKQTIMLKQRLATRLNDTEAKITELERQRNSLEELLRSKQQPLLTVQRRIAIRQGRPTRESVRDGAEQALEAQLTTLTRSAQQLQTQLNDVTAKLQQMIRIREGLRHDLNDKIKSLTLDSECLHVGAGSDVNTTLDSSVTREKKGGGSKAVTSLLDSIGDYSQNDVMTDFNKVFKSSKSGVRSSPQPASTPTKMFIKRPPPRPHTVPAW